jgi:PadR family transcriptional regulator PadR
MQTEEPYQNRIELLQGTLDLLILQVLQWRPRHGYAIAQAIRGGSNEVLQVETGSLYPALHRLEKKGWLRAAWGTTENRQRARFYSLTAKGKKQLAAEHAKWSQMVEAVAALMSRGPEGEQA